MTYKLKVYNYIFLVLIGFAYSTVLGMEDSENKSLLVPQVKKIQSLQNIVLKILQEKGDNLLAKDDIEYLNSSHKCNL